MANIKPKVLNRSHLNMLKYCVDEAEDWRGLLTGNYGDPESIQEEGFRLQEFDDRIWFARQALALIRKDVIAREKAGRARYAKKKARK